MDSSIAFVFLSGVKIEDVLPQRINKLNKAFRQEADRRNRNGCPNQSFPF